VIAIVTLEQVVRDLVRRAEEADAIQATAPVADVYRRIVAELGQVEAPNPTTKSRADRLLSVPQVAAQLRVSERYVYDHHHQWPFTRRVGRKLRFSEKGLREWLRQ
jgi:excisionase family DNA binding protein